MSEFADLVEGLKERAHTYRGLSLKTGISTSHVIDLARGHAKPRYEHVLKLATAYPDQAIALYTAAGIDPPAGLVATLPVPPSARYITERGTRLPIGPASSATAFKGNGDTDPDAELDVSEIVRGFGADYIVQVDGDCLEPQIQRGAWVGIQKATRADGGVVLVQRIGDDDGFSLKVWRNDGEDGPGFYTAKGSRVFGPSEGRIVGRMVGIVAPGVPSFKR